MDSEVFELNQSELYQQIKEGVQNQADKKKQIHAKKEIDMRGIEKLAPVLENLQTISNHNLAVAVQYQNQEQYLRQQLLSEQNKSTKMKSDLKKAYKDIKRLQQQLISIQNNLQNEVAQSNYQLIQVSQQFKGQNDQIQLQQEQLRERSAIIVKLEKNAEIEYNKFIMKENKFIEQINTLRDKNDILQNQIRKLETKEHEYNLEITVLKNTIDKIKSLQDQDKKNIESKNNEWLAALQSREQKLEVEIRLHENKKSELALLERKLFEAEGTSQQLKGEVETSRFEISRLQQKCESLQKDAEMNFKEKIKDINENFINRITNLEAQIQLANKDNQNHVIMISQLTHQLRVSQSQRDILKKECDEFEVAFDTFRREKQMYLEEFKSLREKYQEQIDKLENEVHRLKLVHVTLGEENKDLKEAVEHYKSRLQEILDLHELSSLEQENGFYNLINLMKQKGMQNIKQEDMQQIRQDVLEQISLQKTATMVKEQLKYSDWEDRNYQTTQTVKQHIQEEEDPWEKMFQKLDKIGNE